MGTFIFHNKYHKNSHHTVPTSGFPDSASDPIASNKYPFLGIFYNNISSSLSSNSFFWGTASTLVSGNSSRWNTGSTTFTTVRNNSAFWQNNFPFYTNYRPITANLNSTYTTVRANSSYWNRLYSNTVLYTNTAQENTRQKNFAAIEITPNDISNIVLNLETGQVSYYVASDTSNISGFAGDKRGGIYNFYVTTNDSCDSALKINFNPQYFKFPSTNSFSITGNRLGKFQFISDGTYLHGKGIIFNTIEDDDPNTFYSGIGVTLDPNPYVFANGEGAQAGVGILVQGVAPYLYAAGAGITIVYVSPCS